jgi:hypothetical protein
MEPAQLPSVSSSTKLVGVCFGVFAFHSVTPFTDAFVFEILTN